MHADNINWFLLEKTENILRVLQENINKQKNVPDAIIIIINVSMFPTKCKKSIHKLLIKQFTIIEKNRSLISWNEM